MSARGESSAEAGDAGHGAVDPLARSAGGPTLRERLRPLELLAISGGLGIFAGLVTLLSTREWILAVVILGIAFVLALVTLAMLALGGYEPPAAPGKDGVLAPPDDERGGGHP